MILQRKINLELKITERSIWSRELNVAYLNKDTTKGN